MVLDRRSLITKVVARITNLLVYRIERLWLMLGTGGGWMFFFLTTCTLSYMIFIKKYFWVSLAISWLFSIFMLIWITIALIRRFIKEEEGGTGTPLAGDEVVQTFEEQYNDFVSKYGRGELYRRAFILVFGEERGGKSNIINSSPVVYNKFRTVSKTQGCHWFIAEHEIILDTPGELIKPESGWERLLEMLVKTRPRYPINGIVIVIPIYRLCDPLLEFKENDPPIFYTSENLMPSRKYDLEIRSYSDKLEDKENERNHQQRIKELQSMTSYAHVIVDKLRMIADTLQFQIPVYIIFSKCDLLWGFRDFVNRYSPEKQMVGLRDFEFFETEFMNDLEQWQLLEAGQQGTIKNREEVVKSLYVFLENLRSLKHRLFVYDECFRDLFYHEIQDSGVLKRMPHKFQFRGYYFSSCKQFDIADGEKGIWTPQSKAFFITDLFQKKMRHEYGLARASTARRRSVETRIKIAKLFASLSLLALFAFSWIYYAKSYQKIEALKQSSQAVVKLEFIQYSKEYPNEAMRKQINEATLDVLGKIVKFDKSCKDFNAKGLERWLLIPLWKENTFQKEGQVISARIFYRMIFRTTMEIALQKMKEDLSQEIAEPDKEKHLIGLLRKINDVDEKYQLYQKIRTQSGDDSENFRRIYAWVFSSPIQENISSYLAKEYTNLAGNVFEQLKETEEKQLLRCREHIRAELEAFFQKGFFPKCESFTQIYKDVKKAHDELLVKYNELGNGMGITHEFRELNRKMLVWTQTLQDLKWEKTEYKKLLQMDEETTRNLLSALEKNQLFSSAMAQEVYQSASKTEGAKMVEKLARFALPLSLGSYKEISMEDLYLELAYISLKVDILRLLEPGEEISKMENNQQLLDNFLQKLVKKEKDTFSKEIAYQGAIESAWNSNVGTFSRNAVNKLLEEGFKKQTQRLNRQLFTLSNMNEFDSRVEEYLHNLTIIMKKNFAFLPLLDKLLASVTEGDEIRLTLMQMQKLQEDGLGKVREFLKDRRMRDFFEIKIEEFPRIKGDPRRVSDSSWGRLFMGIKKFYVEEDTSLSGWIIGDLKSNVKESYSPFEQELIFYWDRKSIEYMGEDEKLDLTESLFDAGKILFFSFPGDPKILKESPDLKEKLDSIKRLYDQYQIKLVEYLLGVGDVRRITEKTKEHFFKTLLAKSEKYTQSAIKIIPQKFLREETRHIFKAAENYKNSEESRFDKSAQWYMEIVAPWMELKKEIGDIRTRRVKEDLSDNKQLLDKIFNLYREYMRAREDFKLQEENFFKELLRRWQDAMDRDLQLWKDRSATVIGVLLQEKYQEISGKFPFVRKTTENPFPEEAFPEHVNEFFQRCSEFAAYKEFLGQDKIFSVYDDWTPVLYGTRKKNEEFDVQKHTWLVKVIFPRSNRFITNIVLRKEEQKGNDPQNELAVWHMGREDKNEFFWKVGTPIFLEFKYTGDPRLDFSSKYEKLMKKTEQQTLLRLPEGKWSLFRFIDLHHKNVEENVIQFFFDYKVFRKGTQSITSSENVNFGFELYNNARKMILVPWK